MIDAVIFDLDGTLVDSFDGMIGNVQAVLRDFGYLAPEAGAIRRMMRQGMLLEHMLAVAGTSESVIAALVREYRARYDSGIVQAIRPFPETVPCLVALRDAGLRLAVATSKRYDVAVKALAAAGLTDWFPVVIGHDSVANPKPGPDMVLEAARLHGVKATRCLVAGDSAYDIEMGRAAGARTCAVLGDEHVTGVVLNSNPDYTVKRLDELPSIVAALRDGRAP